MSFKLVSFFYIYYCLQTYYHNASVFVIKRVGTFDPQIAGHFEIKAPLTVSYIINIISFKQLLTTKSNEFN